MVSVLLAMAISYLFEQGFHGSNAECNGSKRDGVFFCQYNVSIGEQYAEDEDDKGGSISHISRTAVGERTSFLKEFPGITGHQYDWKISIALRTIMLLDLPRVEYIDKDKPKVKKSDMDLVKQKNRELEEKRASGKKTMTMAEIRGSE